MLLKVARFKVLLKYLLLFLSFANSNSNDSSVLYGEENGTDFVDAVGRLEFDMFLLRQWAVRLWHLPDGSTLTLLSESYFWGGNGKRVGEVLRALAFHCCPSNPNLALYLDWICWFSSVFQRRRKRRYSILFEQLLFKFSDFDELQNNLIPRNEYLLYKVRSLIK